MSMVTTLQPLVVVTTTLSAVQAPSVSSTQLGTLGTVLQLAPSQSSVSAINTGLLGPPGPPGPPGPSGDVLEFDQVIPSAEWTINHNFGRRPVVGVLSPGGFEVEAEVAHPTVNQVRVYFNNPSSGKALLR